MDNNLAIYDEDGLKSKIYTIRGVQVMLDSDLAEIYGYTTKRFNEQVKNNIEKFDDDFRFQLTKEEYDEILRSKNSTSKISLTDCESVEYDNDAILRSKFLISKTENRGGRQYLPYAFTEQGIYMLMTVLKGDLATQQSKKLIRLFKQMKDYIIRHHNVLEYNEILHLAKQTEDNTIDIKAIKQNMLTKDNIGTIIRNFSEPIMKDCLFTDGQIFDAYVFVSDLIKRAKSEIILIDNYVDETVLTMLDKRNDGVKATIFTANFSQQLKLDLQKHNSQYQPINIKKFNKSHDRFLLIDDDVYLIGASLKDLGKKMFGFTKMEIGKERIISSSSCSGSP
ncbi:MAG: ORF6N domain-containing protein [Bacteroidales bacterium]|nr:ORF6N domain-containing protein [Bacteroidales bacterium]